MIDEADLIADSLAEDDIDIAKVVRAPSAAPQPGEARSFSGAVTCGASSAPSRCARTIGTCSPRRRIAAARDTSGASRRRLASLGQSVRCSPPPPHCGGTDNPSGISAAVSRKAAQIAEAAGGPSPHCGGAAAAPPASLLLCAHRMWLQRQRSRRWSRACGSGERQGYRLGHAAGRARGVALAPEYADPTRRARPPRVAGRPTARLRRPAARRRRRRARPGDRHRRLARPEPAHRGGGPRPARRAAPPVAPLSGRPPWPGRSTHRLLGVARTSPSSSTPHGEPLQQILGAVYAVERFDLATRHAVSDVLRKGMNWNGPSVRRFSPYLAGVERRPGVVDRRHDRSRSHGRSTCSASRRARSSLRSGR